ncbi:MAG: hypothetical protein AAB453_00675 [Patescibacteria group bacterium]
MIKDPLHEIENATMRVNQFMENKTQSVFSKYPVTFSFLVLFGVMSVLHGFDEIIFKIPLLNNHPIFVFLIGLLILIFTGTLYKRLQKRID